MDHDKTFDIWNDEKKQINQKSIIDISIEPRQIWFVKAGKNIGSEQNGKDDFRRPFLVLKKVGNQIFGTYMTTGGKESKWYMSMPAESFTEERNQKEDSKVCMGHAKTIDIRRFLYQIGECDIATFLIIKKNLHQLYW